MMTCVDGNSKKNHLNQPLVVSELAKQLASGSPHAQNISGVMIESNLRPGRQDVPSAQEGGASALKYGVSITDACVDYEMTRGMLDELMLTPARAKATCARLIDVAIVPAV